MHYYQFNIGDYIKSTGHLSILEDIAYRRMLDRYYDTENPLIDDIEKLCRFIRMPNNKKETQTILEEFFSLTARGWIQKRALKELKSYSAKAQAARDNGKKGGRPKKTQSVKSANPVLTQTKAKQETLNKKHKTLNIKNSLRFAPCVTDWESWNWPYQPSDEIFSAWLNMRKAKKHTISKLSFKTIGHGLCEAVQQGFTVEQCLTQAEQNGWKGLKASWMVNATTQASSNAQSSNRGGRRDARAQLEDREWFNGD